MRTLLSFILSASLTTLFLTGAARIPGGENIRNWLIAQAEQSRPTLEQVEAGVDALLDRLFGESNTAHDASPRDGDESRTGVRVLVGLRGLDVVSGEAGRNGESTAGSGSGLLVLDTFGTSAHASGNDGAVRVKILSGSIDADDRSQRSAPLGRAALEAFGPVDTSEDTLALAAMLEESVAMHRRLVQRDWFDRLFAGPSSQGETGWTAGEIATPLQVAVGTPSRQPAFVLAMCILAALLMRVVVTQRR